MVRKYTMDPNIYFTYLCLLDHQGPVREAFKDWRKQARHSGVYSTPYGLLEHEMRIICWQKETQYKQMYIFEAEKAWLDFSVTKFITFLEGLGFKK